MFGFNLVDNERKKRADIVQAVTRRTFRKIVQLKTKITSIEDETKEKE